MIRRFKTQGTADIFDNVFSKAARRTLPMALWSVAQRKLAYLSAAGALSDLQVPPGNRLESLKNDRIGQYSIRINDQYRICFEWTPQGPDHVEIVDYH